MNTHVRGAKEHAKVRPKYSWFIVGVCGVRVSLALSGLSCVSLAVSVSCLVARSHTHCVGA